MSPIVEDEDDPSFVALTARLRHRIDRAFDSTVSSGTQSKPEDSAGGFVVEESDSGPSRHEAGGFIVEDVPSSSGAQSYVPLSEIPRALNLLGLSPDDDVMEVFKNATTGWGVRGVRNDGVSRKDWRAICAALFEGDESGGESPATNEDIEMSGDGGSDSDEYRMEELSDDTGEGSSDEYEEPSTTARAKKAHKVSQKTTEKRRLTGSQRAQCRREFGRFFPHVADHQLDHQRITIEDIVRVADLLKENLKTEEILEMLEAFSTLPDKSMTLADFEHMMILTKLV